MKDSSISKYFTFQNFYLYKAIVLWENKRFYSFKLNLAN